MIKTADGTQFYITALPLFSTHSREDEGQVLINHQTFTGRLRDSQQQADMKTELLLRGHTSVINNKGGLPGITTNSDS